MLDVLGLGVELIVVLGQSCRLAGARCGAVGAVEAPAQILMSAGRSPQTCSADATSPMPVPGSRFSSWRKPMPTISSLGAPDHSITMRA